MQLRPSERRIDRRLGAGKPLYSLRCVMNIEQLCGVDSV